MKNKTKTDQLVVIRKDELEDMIYHYCRIANDQLYKGLSTYLYTFGEEHKTIINELDYIKAYMFIAK
ncbi:hypothetical protein P9E34_19715 [Schinkia azotoformans]|uniref:hypothetical protein n=1 Tax=Schinkia azotoformans TaxID=1454 RepID=UPI002DBD61BC|nr:hypothetical protein [Schinkia azotoformans]MEC1726939.1 hypothetical protein [Schinkia azotoformans]